MPAPQTERDYCTCNLLLHSYLLNVVLPVSECAFISFLQVCGCQSCLSDTCGDLFHLHVLFKGENALHTPLEVAWKRRTSQFHCSHVSTRCKQHHKQWLPTRQTFWIHMKDKWNILTFDPVSLIKADFSLSLGRVRSSSYKDSSWDSAVEASSLASGLPNCAGWSRPGWEGAEGGADDWRLQLKTHSLLCIGH